jgi:hypothetical protein
MRLRLAALLLALGALGLVLWRAELFTVSRPGERPRPLQPTSATAPRTFDIALPQVPVGVTRIASGEGAWLVHYWAPWERHGRAQVLALDSLLRTLPSDAPRVAVVCFDPFPSVARFAARLRLRVPVLLDHHRQLQAALPCPSIPYTWLVGADGRVLVSQPGEVDWLSPETRVLLLEASRPVADSGAGLHPAAASETPRRLKPPGRSRGWGAQARTVSPPGRENTRASSAWPPNNAAL